MVPRAVPASSRAASSSARRARSYIVPPARPGAGLLARPRGASSSCSSESPATAPTRSTSMRSRSGARRCRSRTPSRPRTSALRGEVERLRADRRRSALRGGTTHTRLAASTPSSSSGGSRSSRASSFSSSRTEELGARPAETYASVLAFLGAPPHALDAYPRVFDRDYPPMREETRDALTARFAEPNRRLEELLGRPLGWPAP